MAFMIRWVETAEGQDVTNADPTPYETRQDAEAAARELYSNREYEIIPFPETDSDTLPSTDAS